MSVATFASSSAATIRRRRAIEAVALGASAGGVEALRQVLSGLPPAFPAAVLVVLHLPPERPTALAQLLQRDCALPVSEAVDKQPVVPGTVVALAMILAFLPPLPLIGVSLYGTGAILLIAYLARFLPLVLRPVAAAAAAAGDPAQDEAARIAGISLPRRLARRPAGQFLRHRVEEGHAPLDVGDDDGIADAGERDV